MSEIFDIHALFYDFVVVTLLSLIIGLEQRRHHMEEEEGSDLLFGTDRTFTFIGIFGFILYQLDPSDKIIFLAGGGVISIFLAVFYREKIHNRQKYGLTSIIAALITYCLAPLVITQPKWFALLIVVVVLILTEIKSVFFNISKKFDKDEFITLAKFIVIAFVILPNLPSEPLSASLPLSLYNMWLALVVVSGISYFSYLLRKFVFSSSGLIITGILGGLYSSTAVTILLSKQSNEKESQPQEYAAAIIAATAVMYIRVLIFLFIFNKVIAAMAFVYIVSFFVAALLIAFLIYKSSKSHSDSRTVKPYNSQNPLEFKMGLLFMIFYGAFSFLSHLVESHYGSGGIHFLSFLAGFADVDAFVMNIVQGKFAINSMFIVVAILLATTSNNIIKMIYSLVLSEKKTKRILLIGFGCIVLINIAGILFSIEA